MKIAYDLNNPNDKNGTLLGTVVLDDGELIDLTQQAYITQGGTPTVCWYEAHAESRTQKDEDGETVVHKVRWEITNPEADDAEDACDWDDFTVSKL